MLYSLAIVGIFDSIMGGVDYTILLLSIGFFIIAYLVWPSKRRGQRDRDNWALEMVFEVLIEFPIEFIKFLIRIVIRILGKFDGDIDL